MKDNLECAYEQAMAGTQSPEIVDTTVEGFLAAIEKATISAESLAWMQKFAAECPAGCWIRLQNGEIPVYVSMEDCITLDLFRPWPWETEEKPE